MEQNEKLEFFRELVSCNDVISSFCYDSDGTLLYSNADDTRLYNKIFTRTHSLATALEYAQTSNKPLVISIRLGLTWVAAFQYTEEGPLVHVLGPMFNAAASLAELQKAIQPWEAEMLSSQIQMKYKFLSKIQQLPVVSYSDTCRYALMLHYCLTGEKLHTSDIINMKTSSVPENAYAPQKPKDRYHVWMAEERLLRMIREGDMNYQSAIDQAGDLGALWIQSSGTPLEKVILTQIIFAALCARAAIDGGLPPDTAYSLANSYTQDLQACETPSDARNLAHILYSDFVSRVHKGHIRSDCSTEVQSCLDYIMMHIEEPMNLQSLSERMGYTPYYFSRKFKREVGCSLSEYIKMSKVERSKSLLTSTELSIEDIANRLRFSSRTHYADAFRAIAGCTPVEWRKAKRRL